MAATILALATAPARAEVKPNGLFGDGAVLQQKIAVPVWGAARDGEKVTVKFQGQNVSTVAKDGRWLVKLKPLKAGGPFAMTIIGDNTITITNVLVGEVWLCSGQSNMGFKLYRAENAQGAMAAAADSQLRLYAVPHAAVDSPLIDVAGTWAASSPVVTSNFSAVAYFFGKHLRAALQVPVGLIESSVGGVPAEAFVAHATLENDPELEKILELQAQRVKEFNPLKAAADHREELVKYQMAVKNAEVEGKTPPVAPKPMDNPAHSSKRPSSLYNAMIAPLQPFALAGVIWYQGESNAGRAEQYKKLFSALIQNWREGWGQGSFPFLFVQIAPYNGTRQEIRDAQLWTWQHVPRTAMVGTLDVGEEKNIHPLKKEPVGARLALAARAIAYGEKVEYSGPVFDRMKIKGNQAEISFTHLGSGLMAAQPPGSTGNLPVPRGDPPRGMGKPAQHVLGVCGQGDVPSLPSGQWPDGTGGSPVPPISTSEFGLKGFSVAAADGNFVPANAIIKGDKVFVSAEAVSKPVAVRYGWAKVPDANLFNREGLPATPFHTDEKYIDP